MILQIKESICDAKLFMLTFHRGTQRSYIFVVHPDKANDFDTLLNEFITTTTWGKNKSFTQENVSDSEINSNSDICRRAAVLDYFQKAFPSKQAKEKVLKKMSIDQIDELINAAYDMMNDEARGLMPGVFMSQVEQLNAPAKLTWQQILKRYVGTISADKRRTRTRLNRRQPSRFDLSGRMDDKVLKIVVVIDTSGSLDDHMLGQIIREVFEILAKRKHEVTLIECDARVRRVYRISKPADIQKKVQGRGGTAFTPAIEYINRNRAFRDALMIYFTDGYGERDIPRPRTYRNIWVVFDKAENLSVKEPYGAVIALEE